MRHVETTASPPAPERRSISRARGAFALVAGLLHEVLDREVGHAMFERTESAWENTESRRKERALMAPTLEAIERERQRQIAGMVAAMTQFITALHQDIK